MRVQEIFRGVPATGAGVKANGAGVQEFPDGVSANGVGVQEIRVRVQEKAGGVQANADCVQEFPVCVQERGLSDTSPAAGFKEKLLIDNAFRKNGQKTTVGRPAARANEVESGKTIFNDLFHP